MLFALNPPPLVIGKVPVEIVHLVHCQVIYIPLHKLHRHKMPCHIKVHSTVPECRSILNPHTRDSQRLPPLPCSPCQLCSFHCHCPQLCLRHSNRVSGHTPVFCLGCCTPLHLPYREQLDECLHTVKEARFIITCNGNFAWQHLKGIGPLNRLRILLYAQLDTLLTSALWRNSVILLQVTPQEAFRLLCTITPRNNSGTPVQQECPTILELYTCRMRYN